MFFHTGCCFWFQFAFILQYFISLTVLLKHHYVDNATVGFADQSIRLSHQSFLDLLRATQWSFIHQPTNDSWLCSSLKHPTAMLVHIYHRFSARIQRMTMQYKMEVKSQIELRLQRERARTAHCTVNTRVRLNRHADGWRLSRVWRWLVSICLSVCSFPLSPQLHSASLSSRILMTSGCHCRRLFSHHRCGYWNTRKHRTSSVWRHRMCTNHRVMVVLRNQEERLYFRYPSCCQLTAHWIVMPLYCWRALYSFLCFFLLSLCYVNDIVRTPFLKPTGTTLKR